MLQDDEKRVLLYLLWSMWSCSGITWHAGLTYQKAKSLKTWVWKDLVLQIKNKTTITWLCTAQIILSDDYYWLNLTWKTFAATVYVHLLYIKIDSYISDNNCMGIRLIFCVRKCAKNFVNKLMHVYTTQKEIT
jgi:hypothetical protein